jgi:hypothetical protein
MSVQEPSPPPLPDDLDELLRRQAAALYSRGRTPGDRDRALAPMGARGRPAGAARREGDRP